MGLPTQGQLLLPLLGLLDEQGPMRTKDACDALAERMEIPADLRALRGPECADGQKPLVLDRTIRWARQNAVLGGLIDDSKRGEWRLTPEGRGTHRFAKPGVVVTVWQTDAGSVLWSEFRSAVQYIDQGSVTACFTSPPYPLVKNRSYTEGMRDWAPENYLNTILDQIGLIKPLLAKDGSLILNLGPTFLPKPRRATEFQGNSRNPYMHQLISRLVENMGWSLVDEHYWFNPSKPRTSPQTTKFRSHCVNGMEEFFILSPTGATKCSNWRVLNPYTAAQKSLIARGGEIITESQPSKIQSPGRRFHKDNGGSIPFNFHRVAPDRDTEYRQFCKANGYPEHAAMMPSKLCEFFIELTTERGDIVLDPFGGSLKTASSAFKLDRRFLITERCLNHIGGGLSRLPDYERLLATG